MTNALAPRPCYWLVRGNYVNSLLTPLLWEITNRAARRWRHFALSAVVGRKGRKEAAFPPPPPARAVANLFFHPFRSLPASLSVAVAVAVAVLETFFSTFTFIVCTVNTLLFAPTFIFDCLYCPLLYAGRFGFTLFVSRREKPPHPLEKTAIEPVQILRRFGILFTRSLDIRKIYLLVAIV